MNTKARPTLQQELPKSSTKHVLDLPAAGNAISGCSKARQEPGGNHPDPAGASRGQEVTWNGVPSAVLTVKPPGLSRTASGRRTLILPCFNSSPTGASALNNHLRCLHTHPEGERFGLQAEALPGALPAPLPGEKPPTPRGRPALRAPRAAPIADRGADPPRGATASGSY